MTSFEIGKCIYKSPGKPLPNFKFPYPLARLVALPLDAIINLAGKNLPISGARIKKMAKAETKFESDNNSIGRLSAGTRVGSWQLASEKWCAAT